MYFCERGFGKMPDKIGWIGLGSMGNRMAKNVAKDGYQMIVADKMNIDIFEVLSLDNKILS